MRNESEKEGGGGPSRRPRTPWGRSDLKYAGQTTGAGMDLAVRCHAEVVRADRLGAVGLERRVRGITGIIFDIMKYAIHDGPGIRTVVFLKGCLLRCQWCHNPEGQGAGLEIMLWRERCIGCGECARVCPRGAVREGCTACGECVRVCYAGARTMVGRVVTVEEVMEEIRKDRAFYEESGGGVTFSGGEPLGQVEFLDALLRECGREEIHTAVETTGFADLEDLLRVAEHADLFLYDLKLMDDGEHRKFTGVSNRVILDNLAALSRSHGNVIVRVPVIPGVTDTARNIESMCGFLSGLRDVREVHLLPYHRAGTGKYDRLGRAYGLPALQPPGEAAMSGIARRFEECGKRVRIGG